jgi:hypothetical protein
MEYNEIMVMTGMLKALKICQSAIKDMSENESVYDDGNNTSISHDQITALISLASKILVTNKGRE